MSIVVDDGFFTELDDSRMVTLTGRLGAGKTLLGMGIAERYLARGYRLATNVQSVWGDAWDAIEDLGDGGRRAVVLVDEGGLYIRSMKSVSALAAFARKLDTYIIICGRREPHEEMCELVVAPRFDFRRNFLIPAWLWRWENRGARRPYGGHILEWGRSGLFGVYDTVNPGANPNRLLALVEGWARSLFERYGLEYNLQDVAASRGDDVGASTVDEFARVAGSIRNAVAVLADEAGRKRRR